MVQVKVEGLRDLERALAGMTKATAKATARRALKKAAEPMAQMMRDAVPRGETSQDALAESIAVSTKLSKRQATRHRRMFHDNRAAVEVFVGAGPDPAAHNQEFGNARHGPQPFVRPAWDADHKDLLQRIADEMRAEVGKTAARIAKRKGM